MIIADTTLFIAVFEKKITPFISYLLRLLKASRTFFWNDYELTVTPVNLNDVLLKMFVKSTLCFQQTIFQKKKKYDSFFVQYTKLWKWKIQCHLKNIWWNQFSKDVDFMDFLFKNDKHLSPKIFREIDLRNFYSKTRNSLSPKNISWNWFTVIMVFIAIVRTLISRNFCSKTRNSLSPKNISWNYFAVIIRVFSKDVDFTDFCSKTKNSLSTACTRVHRFFANFPSN